MERYYNTLKAELIYQYNFNTIPELAHAASEFAYNEYKTSFEKSAKFCKQKSSKI